MPGKKHDVKLRDKVTAEAIMTGNVHKTAQKHGLANSTVQSWVINLEKEKDEDIVNLRKKRKQQFIENCWGLIEKGQKILNKKLDNDDEVKQMSISNISTMLGTMYDKQALANDEATEIVKTKLEDFAE